MHIFADLLKGLKGLLLQKVIGHLFACFVCGNRELHATQMMFCNIALGELYKL